MAITLYTSRVLLAQLGVEDYGLYNVVGGIVAMFASLKTVFVTSIQRFLNVVKGQNNPMALNKIFNMGVLIHIGIAIVFILVVEVAGSIMVQHLNVEPSKLLTSHLVLQFSIFTTVLAIISIPYDALIIANEKMGAYAYISIFDAILRLSAVLVLKLFIGDKAILYAASLLFVAIIIRGASIIYCRRNFPESRRAFFWDQKLFRQMTQFAGWNFMGNTAYALTTQGVNYMLNLFGGVAVNAARAIAYQVQSALLVFVENILVAFRPQAMMLYGNRDMDRFWYLVLLSSRISFSVYILLSTVIGLYCVPLLEIWLGEVPQYSVEMVLSILGYTALRSLHGPIDLVFKASARLARYQLIELSVMLLNLPIAYIILLNGLPYHYVFIAMALVELLNFSLILLLAYRQEDFNFRSYSHQVIIPCLVFLCCITLFVIPYRLFCYSDGYFLVLQFGVLMLYMLVSVFFCILRKEERFKIVKIIQRKISL
ncbi:MATE family efflux transporter [Porphyromonas sp. COT-239 OH1446]|uniref:MATE family efflux transporter n=1 Tax=Porphyromonas sp. COT-239 OH1446 TaxID=1515613 RepID=UPI00126A7419|nr:MATE family efflux transporter [Porphyromonas sp. COT-239 OH1446]